MKNSTHRLQADLILLAVSVIWGSAFVVQRIVAGNNSIFLFNGFRFLLAGLLLLPIVWLQTRKRSFPPAQIRHDLIGIVLAGLLLTCGAGFQQAGLRYTTAGNAGFITGLYVVLIPVIQALFLKRSPPIFIWAAAILSAAGLFLLSTGGDLSINFGDFLELAGACFWALHVIWIGYLVKSMDGFQLAAGQYLVCGITSIVLGLLIELDQAANITNAFWAIMYTGVISVGLGYTLQIFGQKIAPPADAAIIMSLEAVFAALFGWIFLSEGLTVLQLIGSGIMLSGMLLAQASSMSERFKQPGRPESV